MKSFVFITAVFAIVAGMLALPGHPSSSPAKPTAETLRQLEAEFMKAAADKGSQGYLSYYADDSVEVPNGGPCSWAKRTSPPA
jgi:hypothetical protein